MPDPPNVVVLLLDTARADRLSPYGHSRDVTPFLDDLAAESTVFDRAYSSSIWSLPAYGSFFTGELPSEHGAVSWGDSIDRNTLVEGLSDAGYETRAVTPHVLTEGYNISSAFDEVIDVTDRSLGARLADDPVAEYVRHRNQSGGWDSRVGMASDIARTAVETRSWRTLPNGLRYLFERVKQRRGYWTDDGAETILDEARRLFAGADDPLFLFANFIEPHEEYRPPREYARRFVDDDVSFREMHETVATSSVAANLGLERRSERQRRILLDLYDAEMAYIDDQLRSFYEWLDSHGHLDGTVLMVLSDHGDLFGEWGIWGHSSRIHNSLCRVPLIVRYPWEGAGREGGFVSLRALHDHLLEVADADEPSPGSLVTDRAFVEYHGLETQLLGRPWEEHDVSVERENCYQASVFEDEHHLLWDSRDVVELYEPRADPDEGSNVADVHPDVVDELKAEIESRLGTPQSRQRAYDERGEGDTVADSAVQQKLKDLGYM